MAVLIHLDHEASSPPPLQNISKLYSNLDIEQDLYVAYLRSEDDGKYHQVRKTHKRYCQDQIKRFVRTRLLPRLMVTGSSDCGPKVQGSALAHKIVLQRYEAVLQGV